ncbi:putative ferric-chelate reductase 1 [Lepisosteus oculatus]|uniref:putative ferric-chelate reductase 1 n=1 Tax=Lepisosteus oculatus TaxID=7918 RepID=UPI00371918FB
MLVRDVLVFCLVSGMMSCRADDTTTTAPDTDTTTVITTTPYTSISTSIPMTTAAPSMSSTTAAATGTTAAPTGTTGAATGTTAVPTGTTAAATGTTAAPTGTTAAATGTSTAASTATSTATTTGTTASSSTAMSTSTTATLSTASTSSGASTGNSTANATASTLSSATTATSTTAAPLTISKVGCSTQKACQSSPTNCTPGVTSGCFFMSSRLVETRDQGLQFEISGQSVGYISFGLSLDNGTVNSEVYICALNGTNVYVSRANFTGSSMNLLPTDNINTVVGSYIGGVISCSFVAWNISTTTQYYIYLANGTIGAGGSFSVPDVRFFSADKVSLLNYSLPSSASPIQPSLITALGMLILTAWGCRAD